MADPFVMAPPPTLYFVQGQYVRCMELLEREPAVLKVRQQVQQMQQMHAASSAVLPCRGASCSCIERACLTFCDIQARARPLPNLLQLLKRKNPAALDETGLHAMCQLAAAHSSSSSSKAGAEAGEERQARLVAASRLIQSHGGCCAVLCSGWDDWHHRSNFVLHGICMGRQWAWWDGRCLSCCIQLVPMAGFQTRKFQLQASC